jgi:spore germination protein GerM
LDCSVTYSVSRQVVLGDDKYSAVLAELLQGPSETETSAGFFTSINPGLELPKITFLNGTLTVDFAPALEVGVGGSCRVLFIRSQIIDTLKQFPEVKEVVISIDGRVDDILQP